MKEILAMCVIIIKVRGTSLHAQTYNYVGLVTELKRISRPIAACCLSRLKPSAAPSAYRFKYHLKDNSGPWQETTKCSIINSHYEY